MKDFFFLLRLIISDTYRQSELSSDVVKPQSHDILLNAILDLEKSLKSLNLLIYQYVHRPIFNKVCMSPPSASSTRRVIYCQECVQHGSNSTFG